MRYIVDIQFPKYDNGVHYRSMRVPVTAKTAEAAEAMVLEQVPDVRVCGTYENKEEPLAEPKAEISTHKYAVGQKVIAYPNSVRPLHNATITECDKQLEGEPPRYTVAMAFGAVTMYEHLYEAVLVPRASAPEPECGKCHYMGVDLNTNGLCAECAPAITVDPVLRPSKKRQQQDAKNRQDVADSISLLVLAKDALKTYIERNRTIHKLDQPSVDAMNLNTALRDISDLIDSDREFLADLSEGGEGHR